ncbi:LacI family DNA-binding transcriptional regulator [Dermabacter hominis]|uniref:LacI family DNA-binding transcriptional regulator n=1 Tax=Dermabacter hominis TaxID=36740 RepID=UPI0021A6469B|nr:LacI family DNA-binding transcriptional regulator [Dermabacter hominis]MCT1716751.1 LacI family transcriptional regulator [Dermabacter hominis]
MPNEHPALPPRTSARRVTIYDIAKHVGVSASTASRALHKPGRVSKATEERVKKAAATLGYRANPAARALPTGRTGTIALLVADITNSVSFEIVRGAEREAEKHGYVLVTSEFREDHVKEASRARYLAPSVDGFVLASSRLDDEAIANIAALNPVVTLNRESPSAFSVLADHEPALRELVRILAAEGHDRLCYLGGPASSWTNAKRWEVIEAVARDEQIEALTIGPNHPTREAGQRALDAVRDTGASAVIAYNDVMAIGLLTAARDAGLRIPEDFSIAGIDDIFGSDFTCPPLTTIAAPLEEMGAAAIRHVHAALSGERESGTDRYPTQLLMRGSVGPAPQPKGRK